MKYTVTTIEQVEVKTEVEITFPCYKTDGKGGFYKLLSITECYEPVIEDGKIAVWNSEAVNIKHHMPLEDATEAEFIAACLKTKERFNEILSEALQGAPVMDLELQDTTSQSHIS